MKRDDKRPRPRDEGGLHYTSPVRGNASSGGNLWPDKDLEMPDYVPYDDGERI